MPDLTTARRNRLRAIFQSRMDEVCVVSRFVRTRNDQGGPSDAYADVLTTVCRRTPRLQSGREYSVAGTLMAEADWLISLPAETDVNVTDRLVIQGHTYEVMGTFDPTDELEMLVGARQVS